MCVAGSIDSVELADAMEALGVDATKAEVERIMLNVDSSNDGN